jgi:VWFA-related protein
VRRLAESGPFRRRPGAACPWSCTALAPLLLLLASLGGATASAQEPERPADTFEEEIVVREVQIDVVVTDRQGHAVAGLGPSDFIVEEDGEPVEVTDVTFYRAQPPGSVTTSPAGTVQRTDRYFVLFFHDQGRGLPALTRQQLESGRRARDWVETELLPNDRVAVLGYDVKLKVYQDFTDDHAAVAEAITRAAAGKKALEIWPSRVEGAVDEDSPSLLANLPMGKELRKRTGRVQEALEEVGYAARAIVGRKNLVLFSAGFGDLASFGQWVPDPRYYRDMTQALNDGNVAVYTIDMIAAVENRPQSLGISQSLSSLAADTGGRYYGIFTTIMTPLRQLAEHGNGYYLLSYRSRHPRDEAGFQEVSVSTRSDALEVEARPGYAYGEP